MSQDPKKFRPLLAASIDSDEQLETLSYPMIASPKVDGIRVIVHPQLGPVTRSLKPVRSSHVRNLLHRLEYANLDGEVVCGPITAPNVFNRTTTGVMAGDSHDEFHYHIFDICTFPQVPYLERLNHIRNTWDKKHDIIKVLPFEVVASPQGVLAAERDWIAEGFEGIMLRHPNGPYKFNRSTLKEQTLLKLKRFTDAEAIITGFEPLLTNQNTQTRNHLGLAERSDHKDGKVALETLGNLLVRDLSGRFGDFSVGSGFDQSQRAQIWNNRPHYLGRTITYKFQEVGVLEAPRFPIFKGFRPQE